MIASSGPHETAKAGFPANLVAWQMDSAFPNSKEGGSAETLVAIKICTNFDYAEGISLHPFRPLF